MNTSGEKCDAPTTTDIITKVIACMCLEDRQRRVLLKSYCSKRIKEILL